MITLENIHTNKIILTVQVVFRNTYVYRHTHKSVTTINEKETQFEREQGVVNGKCCIKK